MADETPAWLAPGVLVDLVYGDPPRPIKRRCRVTTAPARDLLGRWVIGLAGVDHLVLASAVVPTPDPPAVEPPPAWLHRDAEVDYVDGAHRHGYVRVLTSPQFDLALRTWTVRLAGIPGHVPLSKLRDPTVRIDAPVRREPPAKRVVAVELTAKQIHTLAALADNLVDSSEDPGARAVARRVLTAARRAGATVPARR